MKVLYVDDSSDFREIVGRYLRKFGITVATAGSVAEACVATLADKFDVIITDYYLDGETAENVMDNIRNDWWIIVSGSDVSKQAEELASKHRTTVFFAPKRIGWLMDVVRALRYVASKLLQARRRELDF